MTTFEIITILALTLLFMSNIYLFTRWRALTNLRFGCVGKEDESAGSYNTAIGYNSFLNGTSGSKNTTVGAQSGSKITDGKRCTLVGYNAQTSDESAEDEIVIGNDAEGNGPNTITIGSNKTNKVIICGKLEMREEGR